jgi:hypothetical protein
MAAAMLAGATLTAAPSAANAQSAAGARRVVIPVKCDSTLLPSAVMQANAAGTATIRLARSCTYITNTTLSFNGANITLLGGPSTAIEANPAAPFGPILNVANTAGLRVQGIFILGGNTANGNNGGAIRNAGTLVLNFTTLTGNNASPGASGGAVANTGSALIAHSIIKANTATNGGGLINSGILTLFESLVSGNSATGRGGGVFTENPGGKTRIIQSTIDKNTANRGGGADNASNATTSFDRTLVQQNKSDLTAPGTSGGGIYDENLSSGVTIRRTAVRRNTPNNCGGTPIQGCLG